MKSLYNFIVKPFNQRYNNVIDVDGKDLITNTSIDDYRSVSKKALVVSTPLSYSGNIIVNSEIYVHHNIFRRYYNIRGEESNSSKYFKDNNYFVNTGQIYVYKKDKEWKTNLDYCFVKPLINKSNLQTDKERKHFGVLKYSNRFLEDAGLSPGDLVAFTPSSEFEFVVEGERLYCMKFNDIVLTHEYEGNEEENNPSWAKSH